ncbi:MAG: hypothetical protein ABSC14_05315 [Desulfomonilia bacterium]|jgi:hypothetical protein
MVQKTGIVRILLPLVLGVFAVTLCAFSSDQGREGPYSAVSPGALDVTKAVSGSGPVFVSDYFSFAGADEKGHVVFAIDNDRARRGEKFSADAHCVLHDEHAGWITISGAGEYENKEKDLLRIPDSPYFRFSGEVKNGITLDSPCNQLKLVIDPMNERVSRITGEVIYSMGSTSATLTWRDRVIHGRVIYEYIFMKNLSPWYSSFSGLFYNDFQGLYLTTSDGGDFYLHTSKGRAWSKAIKQVLGFQVLDQHLELLEDLRIEVPERRYALGFYRWPGSWRVSWQGNKGAGSLVLRVADRKTVTNWLIGGFAMGVVTGEISSGGKIRPVYGLAELIR